MAEQEQGTLAWSLQLEDLLDDGRIAEAQTLLEGIVRDLEQKESSSSNLTLAAALSDLASLYNSQGLSIKADACLSSALLIKNRAENLSNLGVRGSPAIVDCGVTASEEEDKSVDLQERHEESSKSSATCEEDWETALSEGLLKLDGLSAVSRTVSDVPTRDQTAYRQRGRGAFTYGEMGMRCDRAMLSSANDGLGIEDESDTEDVGVSCGVNHVLMVTFSPKVTTKDLEDLFEPFAANNGVTIRWVNDTTALAVFRNPDFAREALKSIKTSEFKFDKLSEDSELLGFVKKQDLQPPIPRPATSSQAAHRMIMGALRRQGMDNKSTPRSNFRISQKQESDRKERLLMRQKLRDEAWGGDG